MDKKIINKILILAIIIISILSIAYKVLAVFPQVDLPGNSRGYDPAPWWTSAGESEGIVFYRGGDSEQAENIIDSGTISFGTDNSGGGNGSGGGGAAGGGSWSGSAAIPISSPASSYSPDGNIIWYEDVCDNIDVLCTQRGVGITGKNRYLEDYKATGTYWEHDTDPTIDPKEKKTYSLKQAKEVIASIAAADKEAGKPEYDVYYRTSSKYSGSSKSCSPSEAFVLSEAENVHGNGEYTPLQIAWWAIRGMGADNEMSLGAKSFEQYINGTLGGESTTYSDANGTFTGFPIKYEPEFVNTDPNYTVNFNEELQQYIIGPFKIDYYQYEPFAYMNNIDIYADNSETPVNKNEYYIALDNGNGNLNKIEEGEFPANGENFYIILNYNENFKKITNIKADFQYMNAGGNYTLYTGSYTKVCVRGHVYGAFNPELYDRVLEADWWIKTRIILGKVIESALGGPSMPNVFTTHFDGADNALALITKTAEFYGGDYGENVLNTGIFILAHTWLDNSSGTYNAAGFPGANSQYPHIILWTPAKREMAQNFVNWYRNATDEEKEDPPYSYGHGYTVEQAYNAFSAALKHPAKETEKFNTPPPMLFKIWKDLEYINMGDETAQAQSISGGAARWWEYKTIEWKTLGENGGTIKINKEVDGEAKDGDIFEFTLKVDGYEEEKLQITYKNGGENTVESKMYTWENGVGPRYEVTEATKNGYRLENITNRVGNLQDGQTVQVSVKNNAELKNSTLQIYKEIKKTNLDTNQYSLVDKIYKFKVTISGDCEITYGGQTHKVTKEASKTFDLDIRSFAEGASESEKDSKSAKIAVKWYQEAPRYVVEEIPNEQNNAPIAGSNLVKVTPTTGELKNNEVVKVEAQNEITEQKSKIQVIKTLEGYENYSDKELEKFVFRFKVNVYSDEACTNKLKTLSGAEYKEQIIEAKLRRTDDGKWQWIGTTPDEYIWAYGNYPYFKVEEIGICPHDGENCRDANCVYTKNINFNIEKTEEANRGNASIVKVENNTIIGKLNEGSVATGVFDCNVVNSIVATKGVINVNKTVEGNVQDPAIKDALRRKDFNFTIKLKGTFTYNGKLYRDKVIQLTNGNNADKCNELTSIDEYNDKDFVVINLNGANDKTWTSDEITWYGEAPYYIVEEHTAGLSVTDGNGNTREVNVSGVPQAGLLNEGTIASGKYNVIVKAKNSIDENAGYIKIIKKLENSEKCSEDYIKQVRFKFDVKVFKTDGTSIEERTVVLGTEAFPAKLNEKDGTWYWEWESPRYSWAAGANALKYSVEEKNEFSCRNIICKSRRRKWRNNRAKQNYRNNTR